MGKGIVGQMRERITIEDVAETTDGQGGYTEAWSTLATVWAKLEAVSASQMLFSMQLQHRVTHKITIRKRTDLTTKMRIAFEGRIFQIKSWHDKKEDDRFLEVMTEEGSGT